MIEYTHGKCHLSQLFVAHDYVRLEPSFSAGRMRGSLRCIWFSSNVFAGSAGDKHHCYICTPVFQADQNSHTDRMNASLSHTVETIYTPFEFRFHATRMINIIACLIICFPENRSLRSDRGLPIRHTLLS